MGKDMTTGAIAGIIRRLNSLAIDNPRVKDLIIQFSESIGYDLKHAIRIVYEEECQKWIGDLNPQQLDVLEISAGASWRNLPFKSYSEMNYPEYDICSQKIDRQFDLIIADQVFEHLLWPYRAGRNVYDMVKPGGHFLIMTPFLIRVHAVPTDCSRWTEMGLHHFLAECGFDFDQIRTNSWGNRKMLKANLVNWARAGWRKNFPNEPAYPLQVWALARKPT
ncbi:methyltransferase domain-containing protein [Reyranella sp.]|uniref:methyltransferase domain-containing protein n=1 Tax=Reyranella sp. TaxID=1929291 RepID=UPI003D0F0B70